MQDFINKLTSQIKNIFAKTTTLQKAVLIGILVIGLGAIIATIIPVKYIPKVIKSALPTPNKVTVAPAHAVKIGSFALQEKNGITLIVAVLSLSVAKVLVLVIAGIEQPKPIIIGIKALPLTPNLLKILSRIKATLAIYPLSSNIEKNKNSNKI